ncbi:MAG: rod shape-determining protein RodA [Coriobacteriales bacterium]|jgi:rod shape determining protein RodA|nr:rod shape-determining protein RodA [Coriobacteriales bacterium]
MPVQPKIESHQQPGFIASGKAKDLLKRVFSVVNIPLLLTAVALVAYGLLIVRSATANSVDYSFTHQLLGVGVGVLLMLVLWRLDYRRFAVLVVPLLIIDFILILSPLLPVIGVTVKGAQSWLRIFGQQVQPGEVAKIVTILVMAALVAKHRGKLDSGKEYLKCLAVLAALFACVMMQPDLGTALVFFAIGATVLFTGGVNWRWLLATACALVALIVLVVTLDPVLDSAFGTDVLLKDYQMDRLLVFLNEDLDPTGAGYNLSQAKIAIGSGGMFGKGLYQATQSSLGFLPEAPTDFIFCVLAEELGFAGCALLLGLYAALIATAFWIAARADDPFGTLIVMGCVGMWLFQILENIGMTCGLMPITGIPLPFVSYGSSFMLANFMALGLLMSVWAHRPARKAR